MSLQKLENYSNKAVIQEEVLILTELLEDITKNMLAPETIEKIIQLKELSTQIDNEQAAILMAVNALSDQLKKQEKNLELEKEVANLKKKMIKFTEMENRIKRIEAIENEAREVLKENGQPDREIKNHMEAQQILNEKRKGQIKQKSSN